MTTITLTDGQQNALTAFTTFLMTPNEVYFVLSGYSGTGKSTLIHTLLDRLASFMKTAKLINPHQKEYEVELSATTNKAAENFAFITGMPVGTIHSLLGLRVDTDFKTGVTKLVPRRGVEPLENKLIFVDEASYIDKDLLGLIGERINIKTCKVVFIGDPAQLTPVKSNRTPVFEAGFMGAALTEVVRQAKGNPIIELATSFRNTVNTGEFFSFKPDGDVIKYLDRDGFNEAVETEFTRSDWKYKDSKVLAWTNARVIEYNHYIRDRAKGDPSFQEGDYAVCNQFLTTPNGKSYKTDQMVNITKITGPTKLHGVFGHNYELDHTTTVFGPDSIKEWDKALKEARALDKYAQVREMSNWIDLRAVYAQTVNKCQGSTYDRVFIDLDDIRRCNSGDQIARMLYVAVSRARFQVFLTGDIA